MRINCRSFLVRVGSTALAVLACVCAQATRVAAQQQIPTLAKPGEAPVQVMVLGVFHFHNPNADYAKFEGIDVLTPKRQQEIEAIVEQLARFRPTRIAIEKPVAQSDSLNAEYRRYRAGNFELTRNEVHQLGFRLAARFDHAQVYPVDYRKGFRLDSIMAWARQHDPQHVSDIDSYIGGIVKLFDRMQREETLGANLRFMNEPANVVRTHEPYAVQVTVGSADNHIGARMVTGWYERNLHIFANFARIAEPGDRVLLIIGAGHTPIIRHLVETHPSMKLVEAVDYLP